MYVGSIPSSYFKGRERLTSLSTCHCSSSPCLIADKMSINSSEVCESRLWAERVAPTVVLLPEHLCQEDRLANTLGPCSGVKREGRGHTIVVALVGNGRKLKEVSRQDKLEGNISRAINTLIGVLSYLDATEGLRVPAYSTCNKLLIMDVRFSGLQGAK